MKRFLRRWKVNGYQSNRQGQRFPYEQSNIDAHHFRKSRKNGIPFYHADTKGGVRLLSCFLVRRSPLYIPNLSAETGEGIALRKIPSESIPGSASLLNF